MSVLSSKWGPDCTPKCRSPGHCKEMVTAVSHCPGGDQAELELLAFLSRHCHNPGRVRDPMGRGLVHLAVSGGYLSVLQWLLTKDRESAGLNSKDTENGYSPLHRAVFHGQLQAVVFLLKEGANLALCDHDGLTALDHLVLDRPLHVSYEKQAPLEAYVWGSNSNYNLGLGSNTQRNQPDLVEQFRRKGTSITLVVLSKFHSVFVTKSGEALTCGHGRGGRLGHGSETMQLAPRPVPLPSSCLSVALGVDHSVFLAGGGLVLTCGMNNYHQLGQHPPTPFLLAPIPVTPRSKHPTAVGVGAGRFHSLFWSKDSVFTWGLNAGQLGHMKGEKTVIQPKLVASLAGKENTISSVVASDGATVVLTQKGDVIALFEYGTKKLGQRQHNVSQILVTGGHLDPQVDPGGPTFDEIDFKLVARGGSSLKVFVVTKTGRISVWEDCRDNQFIPCLFSLSKEVIVADVALHRSGLLLVSKGGEAWTGVHLPQQRRAQSPIHKKSSVSISPHDLIKLKRIPFIHRGVSAACDPKGRNFCVLQVSPQEALTQVPDMSPSLITNQMKDLLEGCSEDDPVHDVICVIGNNRIPAHSFVLASGAETFAKQLKLVDEATPIVIEIDEIQVQIFRQILQYLYYKDCDLFKPGLVTVTVEKIVDSTPEPVLEVNGDPSKLSAFEVYNENKNRRRKNNKSKSESENNAKISTSNPLVMLKEAAKSLGVYGLAKMTDCFKIVDDHVVKKSTPPKPRLEFSNKNYPELHDVLVVTEDDREIGAHKAILVARSEYFNGMFNSGWSECSSSINLPLHSSIVHTMVEFLYRDDITLLSKTEDVEFVCNLLVVADQFLMTRLKEICECQLSKLLTLKNSAEILQFAYNYSASQLQASSMQFICINLPSILENKSLELLEPEVFTRLGNFYRGSNLVFQKRKMRPLSGYPSQMDIQQQFSVDPITMEDIEAAEEIARLERVSRPRRHSSGDKRRSPRVRHSSTESFSSGSNSDDDIETNVAELDKLNLSDFDLEENSCEASSATLESPQNNLSEGKSYFHSLLSPQATEKIEKPTPVIETKKKTKLSQKERKRLSTDNDQPKVQTSPPVTSPVSSWAGWGNTTPSPVVENSPSLIDIMKMEKTPTDNKMKKSNSAGNVKPMRISESDKKSEIKRSSWKQIGWGQEPVAAKPPVTPTEVTNPWNILSSDPSNGTFGFQENLKTNSESFKKIMSDDVTKKENQYKAKSKPLHTTQIEERAIEELKDFYNVNNCVDEIITVSRVESGAIAPPIWKKMK